MSQYFPQPYERSGRNMKVKLDLCNFTIKLEWKETTSSNTSTLVFSDDNLLW